MVSPACFHANIIGSLKLLHTCQVGVQLLTHLLGHVKVQEVTARPLNQKHSSIAAAASIHCRQRKNKFRCLTRFFISLCRWEELVGYSNRCLLFCHSNLNVSYGNGINREETRCVSWLSVQPE